MQGDGDRAEGADHEQGGFLLGLAPQRLGGAGHLADDGVLGAT